MLQLFQGLPKFFFAVYKIIDSFIVFVRDVTQAYVQWQTINQRPVFTKLLLVLKSLQRYLLKLH